MPVIKLTEKTIAKLPELAGDGPAQVTYYDDRLSGFALVVGRRTRTFAIKRTVGARKLKITIGRHGEIRDDGHAWTATLARQRATEILGELASGEHPAASSGPAGPTMPTVREALALHVDNMQRKRRSPRSIATIQAEITKYLAEWLDRPITEMTGVELDSLCRRIMAECKPRIGSVNPAGAALVKRLVAQVSAIWNAADRLHELPGRNPAKRVVTYDLEPKGERVDDGDMPGWYTTVQTLSPVRRDLQLLTLLTGLRSDSVRHVRWDDLDIERRLLHVARTKGDKPYTVPLADPHIEILQRRRSENQSLFGPYGGDHGWIFPSITRAQPFKVIPVAEPKERRIDKKTGERVAILPGLHTLRRTYNSIALEIGIGREDRERLMNHNRQGVNIKHYGFPQNWEHLADCQARIAAAIWARIEAK